MIAERSSGVLERPQRHRSPDDDHYIMFTSGTTGARRATVKALRAEGYATSPSYAGADLAAAVAGQGIALLPESVVRAALADGRLQQVLPEWSLPLGVLHVVFPSRRGLLPAVRAFIDFLVERLNFDADYMQHQCPDMRRCSDGIEQESKAKAATSAALSSLARRRLIEEDEEAAA